MMNTAGRIAVELVLAHAKAVFRRIVERDTALTDRHIIYCCMKAHPHFNGDKQRDDTILIDHMLGAEAILWLRRRS
jgi:hypothetical protein